jgi:hypothetical protein
MASEPGVNIRGTWHVTQRAGRHAWQQQSVFKRSLVLQQCAAVSGGNEGLVNSCQLALLAGSVSSRHSAAF